jgi:TetR/AcrR family transcriptional repressor of nem operon
MPRKKQFDPAIALRRAMELFWEKGYEATSIQDLVEGMGINRFSLYDTFGGKRDLFFAALLRYEEEQSTPLLQGLEEGPGGMDSIRRFFDLTLARLTGPAGWWGCFMVNTAVELASRDREAARLVQDFLLRLEEALYAALVRARTAGEVGSVVPARALARHLTNTIVTLSVRARTGTSLKEMRQQVELSLSVLT